MKKSILLSLLALAPALVFADGLVGIGAQSGPSSPGWTPNNATNLVPVFNGSIQTFTLPPTNIVNFAGFSGSGGSFSFLLTDTAVAWTTNPNALRWLTVHPAFVTNGVISFTTYGTNVVGAYKECQ